MVRIATPEEIETMIKADMLRPTQRLYPKDLVFTSRSGVLALRPVYYAHSFNLVNGDSAGRLLEAERLFNHADGYIEATRKMGAIASGCLFHVRRDNGAMARFIESKGAIAEPDSILYRYDQITIPD